MHTAICMQAPKTHSHGGSGVPTGAEPDSSLALTTVHCLTLSTESDLLVLQAPRPHCNTLSPSTLAGISSAAFGSAHLKAQIRALPFSAGTLGPAS